MSLDWIGPALLAWAVLAGPGMLLLHACGVRLRTSWGASPPLTVLLVVLAGAIDALLGIPWTAPWALGQLVVVLAVVLTVRLALRRRRARQDRRGGPGSPGLVPSADRSLRGRGLDGLPTLIAIVVGLAMAAAASRGMGGIGTLNGSYDSFFHIAALEFIRADQDAFLLTALQGIYGDPTFYPAGWDVLTALLPFDTITSANAMGLAMLAALPGALAAMVSLLMGERRSAFEHRVLSSVAAACAPMFLSVPVIILVLGLWPFALGALCLPVALGALRQLVRVLESPGRRHRTGDLLLALALVAGAVAAHPSNVFSLVVGVFAALLARAIVLLLRPGRRRRGAVLLAVLVLGLALYGVVAVRVLASMDLTVTSQWPWPALIGSVLMDRPRLAVLPVQAWAVLVIWVLAVIGAIVSLRTRRAVGASALVLLALVLVLSVLTNSPSPLARAWVNPWYGARERIAPLLMCALVVLGGLGVRALLPRRASGPAAAASTQAPHRPTSAEGPETDVGSEPETAVGNGLETPMGPTSAPRSLTRWAAPVALALIGVTTVATLAVPQRFGFVGSLAYTAYGVQLAPYVTPRERAFIERSAAELPADAVVIGNPRDGESLYWSVGGVETVFPTLAQPQTLDSRRVAKYVDEAPENPEVCGSLRDVGPTHLYVDSSEHSGARIAPEASEPWSGLTKIPRDHLELVDHDGPYALYRIEPLC